MERKLCGMRIQILPPTVQEKGQNFGSERLRVCIEIPVTIIAHRKISQNGIVFCCMAAEIDDMVNIVSCFVFSRFNEMIKLACPRNMKRNGEFAEAVFGDVTSVVPKLPHPHSPFSGWSIVASREMGNGCH
mmetsp:Transcript_25295/g.62287  ORF Transcript_25295/g.62287 Transcript_25295/m.62287 type:complete len:131 (-) Transcript_25295:281-673(-)